MTMKMGLERKLKERYVDICICPSLLSYTIDSLSNLITPVVFLCVVLQDS